MITRYIYFLIDPRTASTFYVGMTNSPDTRLKTHSRKRRKECNNLTPTEKYLSEMVNQGVKPEMTIIDTIATYDLNEAHDLERQWILTMMELGHTLTNRQTSPMRFYGANSEPYYFDENGKIHRLRKVS
jgi:hypothetical protein